jgi:CubicO group peptidase (beta-lactamase class C family)
MRKLKFSIGIICFLSIQFYSQTIENKKFDTVFETWKDVTKPGVAAGIIKDGKIIFLKAFGSANVNSQEKNTVQTKFQVDDFAKQFTVLSALILVQKGKISLEDDIRKFLPQLPKYKHQVKVKHLLNHSSGLSNLVPIKRLLGIKWNKDFTQKDAVKIIASQRELNFIPGTKFSYRQSDTEIILLVEIIAKASEKSFIDFTTEEIFKPLGMMNTVFNNQRKLLKNTAVSYSVNKEITNNPINDLTLGATNLYTTAEDLAKFYKHYHTNTNPLNPLVKKLDDLVLLDNGKNFNSSWGIMNLGRYYDHAERGIPKKWQFGLIGGYASNVFRFNTKKVAFFVIGNNNRYNGSPAMNMAFEMLENEFPEPKTLDFSKIKIKKVSSKELKKYESSYWRKAIGAVNKIYIKNDTLHLKRLNNNQETPLVPLGENKFQFFEESDVTNIITFFDKTYAITSDNCDPLTYYRFTQSKVLKSVLNEYKGLYFNKELNLVLTFSEENNTLISNDFKNGKTTFHPIINDVFRSNTTRLSSINFERDNDKIKGFTVKTYGVEKLFFKKIN